MCSWWRVSSGSSYSTVLILHFTLLFLLPSPAYKCRVSSLWPEELVLLFLFFDILFICFYRIKYIYLNPITFTQIVISWILRKRLSDSLWRSGMENMLRQIGNVFCTLSHFAWLSSLLFSIFYYISIFL